MSFYHCIVKIVNSTVTLQIPPIFAMILTVELVEFDPVRISSRTWQRFGKGFAPNSSKAYDYATGNRFGSNRVATRNTRCSAIILCDIAPGTKLMTMSNSSNGPPKGYNSIYRKHGKTSTMMKLLSMIQTPSANSISYFANHNIVKVL